MDITTRDMTIEEHIATARTFLAQSVREFLNGDILQGSEKLWGAASHATLAEATKEGWPTNSHRDLVNASRRIAEEHNEPILAAEFSVARGFHMNFYGKGFNPFRETDAMEYDREMVAHYVLRVSEIASEET